MGQKNFIICDSEHLYAEHLAERLSEKKEFLMKLYAFTALEHCISFQKKETIDILLIEEDYPLQERRKIKASKIFVLTKGAELELDKEEIPIFKYQSSDAILEAVVNTCLEEGTCFFRRRHRTTAKIIGVYSPIHRCGKTQLSLDIGRELAKSSATLYLNLEEHAGMEGCFGGERKRTLSDVLYYAKQEEGSLNIRIGTMVRQFGELDYIMPCPVSMDLKAVTADEWEDLFVQLLEGGIYESLVLDIGECIQGFYEVLKLCKVIYMPVLTDSVAQSKFLQFEEEVKLLGYEELLEKVVKVEATDNPRAFIQKLFEEARAR